ncbi:MAG: alkaline phosphatase family protein [Pseudomonadota bacterium]|nr:alkaline phosphatase family protein [Pseudomonadota bacterium]
MSGLAGGRTGARGAPLEAWAPGAGRAVRGVAIGVFFAALPLVGGCKGCTSERAPHPPSVMVLVLDGVRTDEFTRVETSDLTGMSGEAYAAETWATLGVRGTVVRAALNQGATTTAPAHAALVSGRPETFANFPVDDARGPGLYRPELPTIFEAARASLGLGEADVVLLGNTELLSPVTSSLAPGFGEGARYDLVIDPEAGEPANDDAPVIDAIDALLDTHPPRLLVVNLHDADRAGHNGDGDAYANGVLALDGLLADFWTRLQEEHPAYAESLLLIVTADHGRHRHDEDEGWHSHGDACTGCREVPLMLVGGTRAGLELDAPVSLLDIAPTVAAHLGVPLPWGEGLPITEAFVDLVATARAGDIDLVSSGTHAAGQRWLDERTARSEVWLDGDVVSTPGTYAAEAPTLVDGPDGARVCFRELDLLADAGFLPWRARCLAEPADGEEGAWVEMGFLDEEVGPFFRAALVEREGRTWAAWPTNPHSSTDVGEESGVGLTLAAWEPETGWTDRSWARAIFPTDVALVATTRGLVAAVGTSLGDPDYRYTRRVRVVPVLLGDAVHVEEAVDLTLDSLLGAETRVEHAALAAEGDLVRVAMVGHSAATVVVAASTSADGGRTWTDAVALPVGGAPLPHLAPAWDGTFVVWGVAGTDGAALCRATLDDTDPACVDIGSDRLQSFSVRDGVATVVRDDGVGSWGTAVVTW